MHYEAGRIMPGETLEESTMPDEWMAMHYGWGYITDEDYKRAQTESEDDSNLSEVTDQRDPAEEGEESAKEPVEDPIVCPEEPASSTWRPLHLLTTPTASGGSGKCGGKGRADVPRDSKDPYMEDEYDKKA